MKVDGIEIGTMNEEKTLICPKCNASMEKVEFHAVVVDRCTGCKGLWFDNLEHEKLKLLHGSEVIDTGDPKVGKKYDEIGRIQCPVCHTLMVRMADAKQHHIWYETCPVCSGIYLDAGEFTISRRRTGSTRFETGSRDAGTTELWPPPVHCLGSPAGISSLLYEPRHDGSFESGPTARRIRACLPDLAVPG